MLISQKHNFLYIHIPKSGGTSLRSALNPYANEVSRSLPAKLKRRLFPNERTWKTYNYDNHPHTVMSCAEYMMPSEHFSSLNKFAVIRDPLSWVVSYYKHALRNHSTGQYYQSFEGMPKSANLLDFLEWKTSEGFFPNQSAALSLLSGSIPKINLFIYPDFDSMQKYLQSEFEIPLNLELKNQAPKSQKLLVSDEARLLVEKIFEDDYRLIRYAQLHQGCVKPDEFHVNPEVTKFLEGKKNHNFDFWSPQRQAKLSLLPFCNES